MNENTLKFIEFSIEAGVLRFGNFKLKSGRPSPYFFNVGGFDDGQKLAQLANFYATAINLADLGIDGLFGPAYKGIPLVSTVATALASRHRMNLKYAFDRKEEKDHGEGGSIVGTLGARVGIIDDVVTTGTAIRESLQLIRGGGKHVVSVIVAIDRQERPREEASATTLELLGEKEHLRVISIASATNIRDFLLSVDRINDADRISIHLEKWGPKT